MARRSPKVVDQIDWIDVCSEQPCAVCGGVEDCRSMGDNQFVWCQIQPSEWPLVTGGWLHRIDVYIQRSNSA